jgi:hypothetical protein
MATADEYAAWIVKNQDKKGTPDFDTVAQAYKVAKAEESATAPPKDSVGRQTGLFARSAVKAAAAIPAMGADALGGAYNAAANMVGPGGFRFQQTMPTLDRLMTGAGLPEPSSPRERIVSQGVEMGLGTGGAAALAGKGAGAATGVAKEVLSRLGSQPGVQVAGGTVGGMAGQQSKESGDGWMGQLVSTVVGGMLGAGAFQGAKSGASAIKNALPTKTNQNITVQIDQRITQALQAQGVDPATINPAMRQALREQVRKALKLGDVSDDAIGRLADYKRLNLEPTRGRLTLDPFDITQEMNASKMAAATGNREARLPAIAQDNNRKMIGALDDFNPLSDRGVVGGRAVAPIFNRDAALQANERSLYGAADKMAGGTVPLERGALNGIYEKLNAARKLRFVPESVMGTIDDILNDTRAPFDVNTLDALKTTIATAQRGTQDGNQKAALKIIRDALDDMALTPANKRQFGGSQLVTQQTAAKMTAADKAAADLMAQLNEARRAAFERRSWQRSSPLIENTLDSADPARFVDTILSRASSAADTATAARVINQDAGARAAVRSGIAQALKDSAIGKGNQSATGNFSGRGLAAKLADIGDEKLRLFFEPAEVEHLKSLARVGTIETFQPRGSAVNNSNTAAGVAGLLQGLARYIKPVANKLPLGQEAISGPIDRVTVSMMQRNALNTPQGLVAPGARPQGSVLDPMFLPALAGVNLLSSP